MNKVLSPFTQVTQYFREVRAELQNVTWPTQQQTIRQTTVVIAVSVLVGLYISGLDLVFTELMKIILNN